MHEYSRYVLNNFQIRKSRVQKTEFIRWLAEKLTAQGYGVETEQGGLLKSRNIIAGDPDTAELIFTAHYDTPAVLPFPNIITPKNPFIYLLYSLLTALVICIPVFLVSFIAGYLTRNPLIASALSFIVIIVVITAFYAGKANRNNYNDNTSGVVTLLEIALAMPEDLRHKAAFIFFDHEELMMVGSSLFKGKHTEIAAEKPVINFDCVSDGDYILVMPSKSARGDGRLFDMLENSFVSQNNKNIEICRKNPIFPSDHIMFKKGIGVGAFKNARFAGLYLNNIHTAKDTAFDERNIALLRESALKMVSII